MTSPQPHQLPAECLQLPARQEFCAEEPTRLQRGSIAALASHGGAARESWTPDGVDDGSQISTLAEALHQYACTQLRSDLEAKVVDPAEITKIATRSYRHANGFTKLVLSDSDTGRLRLHVWEPDARAEENIHEHRWHFASVVLTGSINSEIWADSFDFDAPTFSEFIYQVGKRGAARRPVGRSRVACLRKVVRAAGDAYFMLPGVMHRITETCGLTSTLVFTTAPSRSWNRMLAREGVVPDVRRRALRPREVIRLIDLILCQLSVRDVHVCRP